MTTKELILQELERVSEADLPQVLSYLQTLGKAEVPALSEADQAFVQAYDSLKEKRREVYQRLADS